MTYITKTTFGDSQGNIQTDTYENNSLEAAIINKEYQINRWYNTLVTAQYYSLLLELPFEKYIDYKLDMIQFVLEMKNKYCNPKHKCTFSIEIYEENKMTEDDNDDNDDAMYDEMDRLTSMEEDTHVCHTCDMCDCCHVCEICLENYQKVHGYGFFKETLLSS